MLIVAIYMTLSLKMEIMSTMQRDFSGFFQASQFVGDLDPNSKDHKSHVKDERSSPLASSGMTEAVSWGPQGLDENYNKALPLSEIRESLFSDLLDPADITSQFEHYLQSVAGMRLHNIDPRPHIPFTFLLKRSPGIDDIVVARKINQTFYEMGFLPESDIINISVSDLIAPKTAQTGPKLIQLLERSLGKVLLVNEINRMLDEYSVKEAISELVACLGDHRFKHKVVVVLAGYNEDINKLMQADRVVERQLSKQNIFSPMPPEQAMTLLQHHVGGVGIRIDGFTGQDSTKRTKTIELLSDLAETTLWASKRDVGTLGAVIIAQVFWASGKDRDNTHELVFTADRVDELLENRLEYLRIEEGTAHVFVVSAVVSDGDPRLADMTSALSILFFNRYERKRNTNDLDEAIKYAERSALMTSEGHNELGDRLDTLAIRLAMRHELTNDLADIEAAISFANRAVIITPKDNRSDRARYMAHLGNHQSSRYGRTGDIGDINAAISTTEEALSISPEDDIEMPSSNLASQLFSRYEQIGDLEDIEKAIVLTRRAIAAMPQNDPDLARPLHNLGNMLFRQYERNGNIGILEAALSNSQQAVTIMPQDYPARALLLTNLAHVVFGRYTRLGNTDDLKSAISNIKEAIATTPKGHASLAGRLNSLGNMLFESYDREQNADGLEPVIITFHGAIDATPDNHPDLAMLRTCLARPLLRLYQETRDMRNLDAAIANARLALIATREDDWRLGIRQGNLGNLLSNLSELTNDVEYLDAAIDMMQRALHITAEDHPHRAVLLGNLGRCLSNLYRRTGDENHLRLSLSHYEQAARGPSATPVLRIKATRNAIRILQTFEEWGRASQLSEKAVDLLPEVCGRYLNRQDQQHAILQTSGLAADACSLSLKSARVRSQSNAIDANDRDTMDLVKQALRQIEFGRGLILGYLIDSRSDISTLRLEHGDLANELEKWRFLISAPITDSDSPSKGDNRLKAIAGLNDCLGRIRKKPGYHRFLLQPDIDTLTKGAAEGPIVIVNVTDISSDAIIVSESDIRAVELPAMTSSTASFLVKDIGRYRDVDSNSENYDRSNDDRGMTDIKVSAPDHNSRFLSWLWRSCVKPILDELAPPQKSTDLTQLPRVWWIGTGIASSLPFHAAGEYPSSGLDDALSRAICSYTPTIKSLLHARSCAAKMSDEIEQKPAVLIVAMPETDGKRPLPGVIKESQVIKETVGDIFTLQILQNPGAKQVLGAMKDSDIVHFACHGSSDRTNPSDSHLLLQGSASSGLPESSRATDRSVERLTFQQISDNQALAKAQIAYLSACSTAEVKAGYFADEALHIVSAFQVAGFGHVIGSLWSAKDSICAQMAKYFYEYLVTYGSLKMTNRVVAEALREATLRVRREHKDPRLWALYIHSGA
ncbi:hypothetical protein H9Q69_000425 [Fusarium xylarioides]|nr:hypothetical protein H9Q69_000425 [Fusarium xylarioides]